jgi:hypothetical protein
MSFEDEPEGGLAANATIRSCLIEGNHDHGVMVSGAQAALEGVIVRKTQPVESNEPYGRGVAAEMSVATSQPATLSVAGSVIEDSHEVGLFVGRSDAWLEGTIVRRTVPNAANPLTSAGVAVQGPGSLTIDGSLVGDNDRFGVISYAASTTISASVVTDTRVVQPDGLYGDGVSLIDSPGELTFSVISGNERVGAALWRSALRLQNVTFDCNAIDLATHSGGATEAKFEDGGGIVCGCAGQVVECKALGTDVSPPEPLEAAQGSEG